MQATLRTKAAIVTTAVVVGLVALAGWWQYRTLSAEYVSLLAQEQQALTDSAAADLDYKLGMHLSVLSRASQQAGAETFRDAQARRRFLAECGLRPMFDTVALIDTNGAAIANDPPLERPFHIAGRSYFKRAAETGRPIISEPVPASAAQLPAVLMLAPVRAGDGRLLGFVAAGLDLQRPSMLGNLRQAKAGQAGYYMAETSDQEPVVVMHPDAARLLQPAREVVPAADDVVAQSPVPTAGWTLRSVVPAEAADAPLQRSRQALLWQLVAVALLSAGLVWLATGWMMRPLQTLLGSIRTLRRTPDARLALDVRSGDERGELAREFDALMAQLREQRSELAAVLDASPLGLFRSDAEGRIVYVNDAYLQIHGLRREDTATGWLSLVREDIRQPVWTEWQRLVREGGSLQATRTLRRADGSKVQVSVRTRPVFVDGRLQGQVGTVTDISDRLAAERAQRTLTAIFDATTDYVIQADPQGRMTYMNPAARRITGVELKAPIGHLKVFDLNPPETIERLRNEIIPKALADGVWVGDSLAWDAQRRIFPVSHRHRASQRRRPR